ncbi:hypothetical protein D3C71_448410 [compost metagenome]
MGRLHAFGQKILILARARLMFRHLGEVTLVDEHARQGLGVDFHQPAAGGGGANDNVGNDGLRNHRVVTCAGAGVERADFRQHIEQVFLIDAADFFQGGEVAFRQKFQIIDESPHGRVEPILLGQLDRQTFAQGTRKYTRWVEALKRLQDVLDRRRRRSQPFGDIIDGISRNIAGFIELADQRIGDHPVLGG